MKHKRNVLLNKGEEENLGAKVALKAGDIRMTPDGDRVIMLSSPLCHGESKGRQILSSIRCRTDQYRITSIGD